MVKRRREGGREDRGKERGEEGNSLTLCALLLSL